MYIFGSVEIAQYTCHVDQHFLDPNASCPVSSILREHRMDEDKSRLQRDIKELFGCKLGIESDKITERKVSADPAKNGEPAAARVK